jgi:hypothetical protein
MKSFFFLHLYFKLSERALYTVSRFFSYYLSKVNCYHLKYVYFVSINHLFTIFNNDEHQEFQGDYLGHERA